MQSITPLIKENFDEKAHIVIGKVEVDRTGSGAFCELPDILDIMVFSNLENIINRLCAMTFTITCLNINNRYSWQDSGSSHYNWLRQGRKIRIYTGIKYNGIDYYWKWITGRIDVPQFTKEAGKEICTITGRCFMRMLIENRLKQVYWGKQIFLNTYDSKDEYIMPSDCKGIYRAFLDSKAPYEGANLKEIGLNSGWTYDWTTNKFLLLRSIIPYYNGTRNLIIYYFTAQYPEEVVADILVSSGVLREYDRTGWLANSDYVTPVGEKIDRVGFEKGTTCLEALRLIIEAVQYRFYFDQDGNPIFKPSPVKGKSVKLIRAGDITVNNLNELVDEVKNHTIIKGEERTKLVKIPTVTTHEPDINAEAQTAVMYGVTDSVGRGDVNRRGFQWGVALLAVGDWHEDGSFEIGQFEHQLTETELEDFVLQDDNVTPGDINVDTDKITVSFSIPTGSKIHFSTTDVLPAPLDTGKAYYAIKIDSSHVKVADSMDNALEGIPIDLTDQGSGVHTVTLSIGHWYRAYVRNPQGMFFGKWIWIEVTF